MGETASPARTKAVRLGCLGVMLAALLVAAPAMAQESRLDALERQLAEQVKRIQQLEAMLAERGGQKWQVAGPPSADAAASSTSPPSATVSTVRAEPPPMRISGVDISGDLRLRHELNLSDADGRNRSRTAMRARLRASYAITSKLSLGLQINTGDPDDPNSVDVTLGNFDDDLSVSLDQAWMRYSAGGVTAYAGKFPQIFQRTDMVWDDDVSPQGVGGNYVFELGSGTKLDVRALYLLIDEAPRASDSDMLGGQIVAAAALSPALELNLAGGYYHYRLGSVTGADAGDFRGNLVVDGRYLSDFRLIEGIGTLTWTGHSPKWPVVFKADYVRNLGAAVPSDSGFNLEVGAGRTATRGDWRIAYNYSEVAVDAVFAAFSHDNIDLSTNYRLHGLAVGYVPMAGLILDLAFYHYRPLNPAYVGAQLPGDWLDRVRLNAMVRF
jgi:hypothetical protein